MIYVISGNEGYLVKSKIDEIINDHQDAIIIKFDMMDKNVTIYDIIAECNTIDLFADKKIVLVENPLFLSAKTNLNDNEYQQLIDYANNGNSDCELVFYGNIEIDKRKKINKVFNKLARYITFDKMDSKEFNNYAKEYIKKNLGNIDNETINYLLSIISNDLTLFHNEIAKLALYDGKITKKVIDKLIDRPLDDDVFSLTNAIIANNFSKAFKKWNDLKALNNEPIAINLILANQFRFMYQVRVLMEYGYSEKEITNKLKAHPYRIAITLKNVQGIKSKRILAILAKLAKLDQGFKNGTIDRNIGLEKALIEIMR